ncbi:CheR family methyltransferase [Ketogulonicigenium vulgare]|uniref:CheR family methyltransferase n=1 Tax=Ketogulonicigenium vulgare TaxID=92945 RepID=UPI00235899BB|nr:CheR family methyltransferase [Ketogulonicigenium vulgare]
MLRLSDRFPIVSIGCAQSALPALETFFETLEPNPGFAIVIVMHLEELRDSDVCDAIAGWTGMPVAVAAADTPVASNNVYIMPADAILTIEDGVLRSNAPDMAKRERKPVDVFFADLAQDQREYAVGVILSGGNADGTLGAKAIREAGGLTLAQSLDDDETLNPDMPQSAISINIIDLAIPVEEIPDRLRIFARSFDTLEAVSRASDELTRTDLQRAHREICAILAGHSTHDFSGYKTKTFFRRVRRRMQVQQSETLDNYIDLLRKDPTEVTNLFRDLLINVTSFFRDEDAFKLLEKEIIPKLFEHKKSSDTLRIWVPGCATGEEVYSIAILMREFIERHPNAPRVQIFATDIDEAALSVARAGRYPEALLDGLSAERRRRYVRPDGASFVIINEVREMCVFSPHSLVRDPPFSRMDMVSCRNLLIYFGPEVQRDVIPVFHYSLRPRGYLFLGSSESIGKHSHLFSTLDKKHRIFQARDHSPKALRLTSNVSHNRSFLFTDASASSQKERDTSLRSKVESRILERFAPAHVVVNSDADIVYYSAGTSPFLEAPQGVPSRQLMTLARKGLRLDLRAALSECVSTQKRVTRQNLLAERESDEVQIVDFTIEPISDRAGAEQLYLVVFEAKSPSSAQALGGQYSLSDDRHTELEHELRDTKERLQSTIEEYETALEELKSSNEELVSVNEEVQSSNEELEASKEEMQSLNEELNTINSELNGKIEELDRANNDLRNLFESTRIATIFLDRGLVIRTFTPEAAQFFNLRTNDVGRPLTELSSQLDYPSLSEDIRAVFASGDALDHHVAKDRDGQQYLVRVIPYRTDGNEIDGVIVTFVDVTQLAEAEHMQHVLVEELNHRVKNLLLVVGSIAKRTIEKSQSVSTFERAFSGRLAALSRAYGSLSRDQWVDSSIADIFTAELAPFGQNAFHIEGPDLSLPVQIGLSLTMVAHELTTNAAKYGALSVDAGWVKVQWQFENSQLTIDWSETGGPGAKEPSENGFGFELLEGEISYRLSGEIKKVYEKTGFRATITIPLSPYATEKSKF